MNLWVGTSGYNYPEWKGSFYPEKIAVPADAPVLRGALLHRGDQQHVLSHADREDASQGWNRGHARAEFKLTLKAPKRITHEARLKDCAERLQRLLRSRGDPRIRSSARCCSRRLRSCARISRCSMHSWRLFREMFARRSSFVTHRGSTMQCTNASKARNLALCVADSENAHTPAVITASYGYFRLRDEGYSPQDLERWAQNIRDKTAELRRHLRVLQARGKGHRPGVRANLPASLRRALSRENFSRQRTFIVRAAVRLRDGGSKVSLVHALANSATSAKSLARFAIESLISPRAR